MFPLWLLHLQSRALEQWWGYMAGNEEQVLQVPSTNSLLLMVALLCIWRYLHCLYWALPKRVEKAVEVYNFVTPPPLPAMAVGPAILFQTSQFSRPSFVGLGETREASLHSCGSYISSNIGRQHLCTAQGFLAFYRSFCQDGVAMEASSGSLRYRSTSCQQWLLAPLWCIHMY